MVFLLAFAMVMVSASTDYLGTYKQYDNIRLLQTCNDGTDICDYCTASVIYPNGTFALSNGVMTSDVSVFYYDFSNTDAFGEYSVNGICGLGTSITQFVYYFDVTPTGDSRGTSWIFVLYVGSLVLFVIGLFIKNPFVILISAMGLMVSGLYTMLFGFNNLANMYTQAIALISICLSGYLFFASIMEVLSGFDSSGGEE